MSVLRNLSSPGYTIFQQIIEIVKEKLTFGN